MSVQASIPGTPAPPPRPSCPNATIWRPSCKRRGCRVCGPRWARDWYRVMRVNLEAWGGEVAMLTVTPPGADQLPWDRERCRHRSGVKCSGTKHGCKVQQRALREWSDTLTLRLGWLRRAAYQATKREGHDPPAWLERAWEPQKRGTPHLHAVVPYGSPAERAAVDAYYRHVKRLAPRYAFGHEVHLAPMTGAQAARYIASYLTGRNSKRKDSIRENIADPNLPRSLVWMTPKLTRVTKVTMRTVRRARHLYAAMEGICDPPRWRGFEEALVVGHVYRRIYRRRGDDEDAGDVAPDAARLDLARWLDTSGIVKLGDEVAHRLALDFCGLGAAA